MTDFELMLKDISLRYQIPYPVIERVYMSEFHLVRKAMSDGDRTDIDKLNVIYLKRLGRIVPNSFVIDAINKRMSERRNNDEQREG